MIQLKISMKRKRTRSESERAESDPETTGPADNLREEAAETVDEEEGSQNPHNFLRAVFLF